MFARSYEALCSTSILGDDQKSDLTHYYAIQIGAFRTQMNDRTYNNLKNTFGDQFQIFHDRNLEMD